MHIGLPKSASTLLQRVAMEQPDWDSSYDTALLGEAAYKAAGSGREQTYISAEARLPDVPRPFVSDEQFKQLAP